MTEAVARSASLTNLDLSNNQITDVGASALAEAVARSASLTALFLSDNHITDISAIALARGMARSSKLTCIEFDAALNRLTTFGRQALNAAYAAIEATRPTLWLLAGAPTSSTSPAIL